MKVLESFFQYHARHYRINYAKYYKARILHRKRRYWYQFLYSFHGLFLSRLEKLLIRMEVMIFVGHLV